MPNTRLEIASTGVNSSAPKGPALPPEIVRSRASSEASGTMTDATSPRLDAVDVYDKVSTVPGLDGPVPKAAPPRYNAAIDAACVRVVDELKRTVGWDIDANRDVCVEPIDRKSMPALLQRNLGLNYVQAWILSRVLGVVYLPSLRKIVVCKEVTRSWHPSLISHEVAKAAVRLSLGLYANQQAFVGNQGPLKFEEKLLQAYTTPYCYHRPFRAMNLFHAAHAETVAKKQQPTTHTAPLRQKFWGIFVWLCANTYFTTRTLGRKLASDFDKVLASSPDRVNRIYANGGLTELWYGGLGTVHIDSASPTTRQALTADGQFLHSLNPNRGAVVAQINVGSTQTLESPISSTRQ